MNEDKFSLKRKMDANDGCDPAIRPSKKRIILLPGEHSPSLVSVIAKYQDIANHADLKHAKYVSELKLAAFEEALKATHVDFQTEFLCCIDKLASDWYQLNFGQNVFGSPVRVVDVPQQSKLVLDIVDVAVQAICYTVQEDLQIDVLKFYSNLTNRAKSQQTEIREDIPQQGDAGLS
jgi:hypothetical protein